MKATISSPPGLAYGADDVVPDMPEGLSVEDAIYHTVHGYPGGVTALAARMGVSANTLTHKANPNNSTHHLHPRELVAMQYLSGNAAVLQSMAHSLRYTCTPLQPIKRAAIRWRLSCTCRWPWPNLCAQWLTRCRTGGLDR